MSEIPIPENAIAVLAAIRASGRFNMLTESLQVIEWAIQIDRKAGEWLKASPENYAAALVEMGERREKKLIP